MSTDATDTDAASGSKNFSRTPTSWDPLDDILLMHLKDTQKLGWKEIALHFTNRTPNACQFRWRRLKSGNLKNPPKSAAALPGMSTPGAPTSTPSDTSANSRRPSMLSEPEKKGGVKRRISELSTGIGSVYSPLSNTTFTGYDTVSTALAGLNALSHTGTPASGAGSPQGPINTTSHPQTFENLPKLDVALDPQAHSAAAGSSGGYFTDISVDPTLNLPHNKPHPVPSSQNMTPRHSAVDQNLAFVHNNSIIQIVRDDRNSVSSQLRHSVLSLPSKSMDIPHHQSNSLAHLPVLFGGSSISGPSGHGPSSVSGPLGLPHLASTLSSIRNGSIVGPSQAYLRRLSMLIVHGDRRLSEKDRERRHEKEKSADPPRKQAMPELTTPGRSTPTALQPVFKIPWSMEEDELLINRRRKELSFAELSILLPQRTEGEIWSRIDALERLKNGHRALVSRARRHRQSLLGLDDVDDFYDDVDSVIDGIDSEDDDHNDDVLLDVDDSILGHHRMSKKRRASSAVNPLSVRDGIRGKLH
ncbi:hypothetical protein METBIDRAFT_34451 [Metschnikowia bicuspidata var. bicuspidata NRRL YB-4993]|uniref:Myb-like domain-containing protein n=1 Tax=Metschnikowia bicuspidata var. bicuspidata NRRL YB-4993 TaxID=869754 RepID=A0A1A0HK96_9ASCO|nr:hypothetical protein METBIDRAFT_34451 [Metschnikowia bicuspidata var. bicuspidata NRRL YB-4993]OBA24426.1 hypothetical protein METBIDRAFT_34451 [Metschnikowia bicuspidata var. bicuspidata NRRL YB-4993]